MLKMLTLKRCQLVCHYLLCLIISIVLLACQSTPRPAASLDVMPATTTDQVMQRIEQARRHFDNNQIDDGVSILQSLSFDQLTDTQQRAYVLARGQLGIVLFDAQQANNWLNGQYVSLFDTASSEYKTELRLLRADLFALQGEFLSAARERVFVNAQVENRQQNHDLIWRDLQKIDSATLTQLNVQLSSSALQSWLQLVLQYRQAGMQLDQQSMAISRWQQQHPTHAAARSLPSELALVDIMNKQMPRKIALILPLSGTYKTFGQSIRAGVLSRIYLSLRNQQATPEILLYDIGAKGTSADRLYQQAVSDGAEFVIGPLLNDQIQKLYQLGQFPVPVVVLGGLQQQPPLANFYQFDLALDHEAVALAKRAKQDGHLNAAIIYSGNSPKRQQYVESFRQQWQQLGGKVVSISAVAEKEKLYLAAQRLLSLNKSHIRAKALYQSLDADMTHFEPRPRQDIDFIFMVVPQKDSLRLKPVLNQQYAADIPVYALSEIYRGEQPGPLFDLNGVRLQTMPWLLESSNLKQSVNYVYSASEQFASMVALGVDAYQIVRRLQQFDRFPQSQNQGATGVLYQSSPGVIQTQRRWIEFKQDQVLPIAQ